MADAEPVLTYDVRDGLATVVMSRPRVLNALSLELRQRLAETFTAADRDDGVQVVVLAGAGGRSFSVGADLKEAAARRATAAGDAEAARASAPRAYPPVARPGRLLGFDEVRACSKPVIAAIDGYCLGGGLELALCCDIRLATVASTFGLPEPRHHLLGGPGIVHLSRMIPLGEAMKLHMTAEPITADRAYQIGLVQGLSDDRPALDEAARRTAAAILASSPLAVQFLKRVVGEGRDMTVEQQWRFAEMFAYELQRTRDGG